MKKFFFKIKSRLIKIKIKLSRDSRPSSYPYLSGDGFRKIADHLYDETAKLDPTKIKSGEIVFIKTDMINEYFDNCHKKIRHPYKIITHNSDKNITEKELGYLDNKIIHWFAQNVSVKHPKITPLPIGLENLHYYLNGIPKLFNRPKGISVRKKSRIIFGFSIFTNKQERQVALNILSTMPLSDKIKGSPLPPDYLSELNSYQFVASPPGNGLDCHRTWEALYLGVIPIVKRSVATEYFKNLKLPILIIDNWSDLGKITKEDLSHLYNQITSEADTKELFMNYWISLIKNKK